MKRIALFIAMAVMSALLLAGCAQKVETSSFGVMSNGEAGVTITAENADKDSSGETDFTIGENVKVVFDATSLTSGKLQMQLKDKDGNELQSLSVSAKESASFDNAEPGEYQVVVSVLEKADGTAKIITEAN